MRYRKSIEPCLFYTIVMITNVSKSLHVTDMRCYYVCIPKFIVNYLRLTNVNAYIYSVNQRFVYFILLQKFVKSTFNDRILEHRTETSRQKHIFSLVQTF